MSKKVEAVVSAMGVLLAIIVDLARYIREFGGDPNAGIHLLSQPDGQSTLKEIARLIAEAGQRFRSSFHLVADYGLSIAQMISLGKYDWVNSDINAENFPVTGQGQQAVEVEFWHPNMYFSNGNEVIAELEQTKSGYRFATLPELLALGAAQSELQLQFPIAALGSIWHHASYRYFAYLDGGGAGRGLSLGYLGFDFRDSWRFAVVRKQS